MSDILPKSLYIDREYFILNSVLWKNVRCMFYLDNSINREIQHTFNSEHLNVRVEYVFLSQYTFLFTEEHDNFFLILP